MTLYRAKKQVKRKQKASKMMMSLVKEVTRDALLTFLWLFCMPMPGIFSREISKLLGIIQPQSLAASLITLVLFIFLLLTFSYSSTALGGASYNPSTAACNHFLGLKKDSSLRSLAARFTAQAAASVFGVRAILKVVPTQYKHILQGPSLKVNLHIGAIVEGVFTFLFCLFMLVIMYKGPKSFLSKLGLLVVTIVGLFVAGSGYTGPALNPAAAFGWACVNNLCYTLDHFYVYWICPLIGAVFAARVFRFLFPGPIIKRKKT